MSQSVNPATTHDNDLLPLGSAQAFREWLERSGAPTRDAKTNEIGRGILFWAMVKNWVSVDAPRTNDGKHALTHKRLRGLINDFLLNPLVSAVRIGSGAARPTLQPGDVRPGINAERRSPAVVRATPTLAIDPAAPGGDKTVALRPTGDCSESCGGKCAERIELAPFSDADLSRMVENTRSLIETSLTTAQRERLEDLRDDFALHAPLVMKDRETLADYALRRWEYAKVMMETRPH